VGGTAAAKAAVGGIIMPYAVRISVVALASLFLATASFAEQHGHADEGDEDRRAMAEHCPWAQPDVDIEVEDTQEGIALTFRGEPEQQEELRQFAHRMAAMHQRMRQHRGRSAADDRGGMGQMMMQMPEATVEAEDVEGGARVEFRPQDPEDREALREHVRQRAEMMRERRCPIHVNPEAMPGDRD
jgi:hypothetical protein